MYQMFYLANSFAGNISAWNVTKVTTMQNMFGSVSLPSATYDAILNAWSAQAVKTGVLFNGGYSDYSSAATAARATLTGSKTWTIADGDQI